MLSKIKAWWVSNYCIISLDDAKEMNLEFVTNIYGDRINVLNCRSIWVDNKQNPYRCGELYMEDEEVVNNFVTQPFEI
jgi:hypothetical protein